MTLKPSLQFSLLTRFYAKNGDRLNLSPSDVKTIRWLFLALQNVETSKSQISARHTWINEYNFYIDSFLLFAVVFYTPIESRCRPHRSILRRSLRTRTGVKSMNGIRDFCHRSLSRSPVTVYVNFDIFKLCEMWSFFFVALYARALHLLKPYFPSFSLIRLWFTDDWGLGEGKSRFTVSSYIYATLWTILVHFSLSFGAISYGPEQKKKRLSGNFYWLLEHHHHQSRWHGRKDIKTTSIGIWLMLEIQCF